MQKRRSPPFVAPDAPSGPRVLHPEPIIPPEGLRWWLRTDLVAPPTGLSDTEARAALVRYGPNRLTDRSPPPLATRFIARFKNPLILLLLAASAMSAVTGDVANAAIIIPLVLLSVTLDFLQEHRADRAAEKLRDSVSLNASVIREGKAQEVPLEAVVPASSSATWPLAPYDDRPSAARAHHDSLIQRKITHVERRYSGSWGWQVSTYLFTAVRLPPHIT